MRHRAAPAVMLLVAVCAVAAPAAFPRASDALRTRDPQSLIVHEWGTFTSIAGADGDAVQWLPANGPADLPCFVREIHVNTKGLLAGTVRMETPVLYFYASRETTVNVAVRFRQGAVTEWFPDAAVTPAAVHPAPFQAPGFEGTITWRNVKVLPGTRATFPRDNRPSHYYAARETDAAPLQVGSTTDRFLFYRGVGTFALPIAAVLNGRTIDVHSTRGQRLGDLVVFENRGGVISYAVQRGAGARLTIERPTARGDLASMRATLERLLVAQGLYPREAAAMVATWRDSWFEEGARLLYIVPKSAVDSILPLDINPKPAEIARVFVGRLELVTPELLNAVNGIVERQDRASFERYGRFFGPIFDRLLAESAHDDRVTLERQRQAMFTGQVPRHPPACQ
jgi:hypothetical protein